MTTEIPTNDFRQVQHRAILNGGNWYTFFVLQRRWLIETELVWSGLPPKGYVPDPPREEWREVPIVAAGDVK